ncbi:diguanylate cyclase [Xanthomonas hyacinthi]|uniref:diguanylate cyclase n=1 Tax=Xanthomonas hyacinthi TaxID=56455 RepID=A0A2S7EX76_9XANT|nr:diguanylate cyclase [Xanthomonas hyacinthi]PPU97754.1 GGDEF domain-containing protein [Xanthomonas hyacinthi]QGY77051.1 diguanylate cyclase [Xanthomonas hyacinthi]
MTSHRSLVFLGRTLLVAITGLSLGPAPAQTIGGDPYEAPIRRCRTELAQQPRASLGIASDLLTRSDLPLPVQVMATGCLATAQHVLGDGARASASVERLLTLLHEPTLPPALRAGERLQAAQLLQQMNQVPRAVKLLEQVQADALASGDIGAQISALMAIGLMRGALDDHEGALTYFRQAIALAERLQRPASPGDITLYYNYGYALLVLKRYEEADRALEHAARTATTLGGSEVLLNRIVSHRGDIQRASGHLERAEPLFRQALQWQQTHGDPQGAVVSLQRLARLRLDQKRSADALAYAEQAQALATRGNFMLEIRDGLDLLGEIHSALGDNVAAARDTRQAHAMDRAKARGETIAALAKLQADAARTLPPAAIDASMARADNAGTIAIGLALALTLGAMLVVLHRRRQRRALDLGQRDPLTGLLTRPEAERRMQALFAAAADTAGEADSRCALVLVDVDGFKALNARYGHAAGDRALLALASCLREGCDADDLVARWGSEEFLVVRADTSAAAAFALAAHLRGAVERLRVDAWQGETLALTVSVGVVPFPLFARSAARLQDSMALAERAVHTAGHAGGNAWAGLWGVAGAAAIAAQQVVQDPLQARAQGWVLLDGSDPLLWTHAGRAPAGARPA